MGERVMGVEMAGFAFADLPVAAMVTDDNDHIVWVNEQLCLLLRTNSRSLIGAPLDSVMRGSEEILGPDISRYTITDDEGQRRWLQCSRSERREGEGCLRCFVDITEFQSRRGRGRFAALAVDRTNIDAETGVLNRLSILKALQTEISRSRRYGNPLSALMVCVRSEASSVAVSHLVESASQVLRWVDSMGRLDDATFLVVLPETHQAGAQSVGDKIVQSSAELSIELSAEEWGGEDSVDPFLDRLRGQIETVDSAA
ncbi:MAG: PAS domain-containing protein [Pseudomonadota bacterium]